ncbi:putative transglutaminase-like cysteine proteinase [Chitinivorax tropicus]|uniref:Putative transglutaminase-like cysteine proteinase n=1 Tax=Chitinivorax tropicus TaxID=714531 RepID=A0A840MIJ0_9PROT|nr:putative transglutaminase-like cysteine proteinase [Chitinivorax tropicus]
MTLIFGTAMTWAADLDRMQRMLEQQFGKATSHVMADLRQMLIDTKPAPELDKLQRANEFFNRRLRFVDDKVLWGRDDYWATPVETLGKGGGDCEDFSIAKYFALRSLDVAESKLRLVYVKARVGGGNSTTFQAHMVLAYYAQPDAEPLVLDNLIGDIRPASRRPDLLPVFSFNGEGMWVGNGGQPQPIDRLSRWKELLLRMHAEGSDN